MATLENCQINTIQAIRQNNTTQYRVARLDLAKSQKSPYPTPLYQIIVTLHSMLRFVSLLLLFFTTNMFCYSQGSVTNVDYTVVGAPIPFLKLAVPDTAAPEVSGKTKKRKRHTDEDIHIVRTITNNDLGKSGNLLIMMFSPLCEHCEAATGLLEKNINLFKGTQLVLMTNERYKADLPDFMKRLHTLSFPALTVGYDDTDFLHQTFLYQPLPQINIYNKERKLIRIFTGDVVIDSLKPYLN